MRVILAGSARESEDLSERESGQLQALLREFDHVSQVSRNSDLFQFRMLAYYLVALIAVAGYYFTKISTADALPLDTDVVLFVFVYLNLIYIITLYYPGITTVRADYYILKYIVPKIDALLGRINGSAVVEWWLASNGAVRDGDKTVRQILAVDIILSSMIVAVPYFCSLIGLVMLWGAIEDWNKWTIAIYAYAILLFLMCAAFLVLWIILGRRWRRKAIAVVEAVGEVRRVYVK